MITMPEIKREIDSYVLLDPDSPLKNYTVDDVRYRLINNLLGTPINKMVFVLHHLLSTCGCEGDVCEFGVAQGRTSALLAYELLTRNGQNKILNLYDSFEGLPNPTEKDVLLKDVLLNDIFKLGSMEKYAGYMKSGEDEVMTELEHIGYPLPRYRIVKGFVDENTYIPDKVCFAYLDMDLYEPTKLILWALHERMCEGGRIVIDDYGFFSSGVKLAVDEFYQDVFDCDNVDYKLEVRHAQASLERL